MKLINPNELMSNLYMEYGDEHGEVDIQVMLNKLENEINDCQDYSKELWWNKMRMTYKLTDGRTYTVQNDTYGGEIDSIIIENSCDTVNSEAFVTEKDITEEKLNHAELMWNPELLFAENKGYKLVLDIDAFNDHMYWNVKWFDRQWIEHYVEFADFSEARDYFLKKINK